MKKLFTVILLNLFLSSTAQKISWERADYLGKSKEQRVKGFITLGIGTAALVPGVIMLSQTTPGWETVNWGKALGGSVLAIIGTTCIISSVVLFASSEKNRKRADRISFQFNKPVQVYTGLAETSLPYSVGLNIVLR